MGHYLSEMESDDEYRRRVGLPPLPRTKLSPVADSLADREKVLQRGAGGEYGILITRESGRHDVWAQQLTLDNPVHGIPREMLKFEHQIKTGEDNWGDPIVGVELVSRTFSVWEVDRTYVAPSRCLELHGTHDFQGDYGRWESQCSRCHIYQN